MATTIQHPEPLKAAKSLSAAGFSTVGNPALQKIRVFQSPRGKQVAIVLENAALVAFTEPAYDVGQASTGYHKRRYAAGETRNANLNFSGCRLGKTYEADSWIFPGQADFRSFIDWYQTL